MPTQPIPFVNDQKSGDQELAGASPLAVNVITDGSGAVRRRPGISAWDGFPSSVPEASAVIGMHAFEDKLVFITEETRKIWRVTPSTAVVENLSTTGGSSYLLGNQRPTFAETQFRLVMTGGGVPTKLDTLSTACAALGGSPPASTHIVGLASRLISNDRTGATSYNQFRFSSTGSGGNETWSATNVFSAEAQPDAVVALLSNSNELFTFGERTLQVWQPAYQVVEDVTVLFNPGRALNRGCAAPYSVIESDESFSWLDERRRFLSSNGRGIEDISAPIGRTLDDVATVSDCFGFRWLADQFDVLCWVFPTDGRSFAIQAGGGWAQWHSWTDGQGHTPVPITSHYYWPEENINLVGLATGQIAVLDSSAPTDLGDTIKAEVRTGFLDRGTAAHKHCQAVRFFFKRGHTSSSTVAPQVLLSWRDTLGDFCSPIRMDLGVSSDYIFSVEKRSLGTYRSRQWRLEFTDAVDFVLAKAEETFTVGGQN